MGKGGNLPMPVDGIMLNNDLKLNLCNRMLRSAEQKMAYNEGIRFY
jgi:hypothetical protein